MAKKSKTLEDEISQSPERFTEYLDIDAIAAAENHSKEFVKQFTKEFGKRQGLNLMPYIENHYQLLNKLYKSKNVQNKLPKRFKGSLNLKENNVFWEERVKEVRGKQREIEKAIEKPFKVKAKGKEFARPHPFQWKKSPRYDNFVKQRLDYKSNLKLAFEFNQYFGVKLSAKAIADRKARILGVRGGR